MNYLCQVLSVVFQVTINLKCFLMFHKAGIVLKVYVNKEGSTGDWN